jgi:uncharacterized protein (TIGR03032 family)
MLHSGAGQLVLVDPASGKAETVTELPGYTRGLALYDHFAFVGLSKIRETSTFGGMPIADRRGDLKCGVGVVDLLLRRPGAVGHALPGGVGSVSQSGRRFTHLDGAAAPARLEAVVKR